MNDVSYAIRCAAQEEWTEAFADWRSSHGEARARARRWLRRLIARERQRLAESRAELMRAAELARARRVMA